MRRLTIIVASCDQVRLRVALELAATAAALDRPSRLFLHGDAAGLLGAPAATASDDAQRAAGSPALAELVNEAISMGVAVIVCQSGMAMSNYSAESLPDGVTVGGLISLPAGAEDDQLLLA